EDDAVPFGVFGLVAGVLVLAHPRGRDRDVADRAAVGRVAHFGIATEVADDDDLVDRRHDLAPVRKGIARIMRRSSPRPRPSQEVPPRAGTGHPNGATLWHCVPRAGPGLRRRIGPGNALARRGARTPISEVTRRATRPIRRSRSMAARMDAAVAAETPIAPGDPARGVLRDVFGYAAFRGLQQAI